MHRFFTITFVLFLVNVFVCSAQDSISKSQEFPKVSFGIKGGLNISTFSSSINSESRAKVGLALGIYLKKQIGCIILIRAKKIITFILMVAHQSVQRQQTCII